jgi:hypothetical protein
VIASHILIQAGAGPAAIVTAAPGEVPGAAGTASVAGPGDVIAPAGRRGTAGRARPGASRARGLRRVTRPPAAAGSHAGKAPMAARHFTAIRQLGEGAVQAVCSCGWRSAVFGAGNRTGTMDPLQHAAEAADLHEWEMSLQ